MRRREFITLLGGAAATWPLAARAQRRALPVVAMVSGTSVVGSAPNRAAFRRGLGENGLTENQNVTVEYHWLDGQYDRLPALMADLVRRRVAVIAASPSAVVLAAKAATTTVPIVFTVAEDPVRLGLVASLDRPGGNLTGVNFFGVETVPRRLGLLHALVPKAVRIGVLVDPGNAPTTAAILRDMPDVARSLGLEIQTLNASTAREMEVAFAAMERERAEALFVAADPLFGSHRVQLAILAASHRIPAVYSQRFYVEAGGLMSYGASVVEGFLQMGIYAGLLLKRAKPADLPVIQTSKYELVINLQTARAIGLTVSPDLLSIADEVIE
jgi:putative ABC transport system substrate-binding protein